MTDARALAIPALLLVLLLLGAAALRLDDRAQRLERRVAALSFSAAPAQAEAPRSIRVASRNGGRLRAALRAGLGYPGDLPAAHVLPAGVVAALGLLAGLLAGWLAAVFVSPALGPPAGLAAGALLAHAIFVWERRRYADLLRRQMPDMIELVASSVRSGLPVAEAFRAAARELPPPTCEEFARVVREMALGSAADAALMELHRRSAVAEYAIFAVTLGVQSRSGGRLAETIQMLAETIRQRVALAARASALAAEAKLSAMVLTALPFCGGGAMAFLQKGYLDPLLHDPRGRRLVAIGAVLLALGQVAMRRLIASATREA